ncbi:MAG TPA: hypothetical protein VGA08_03635 [Candidatus Saccharimonadales bacterium]
MNTRKPASGFIMASLLITTTLVLLIGISVTQLVVNNFLLATNDVARFHSQSAADAGLDYGIATLNTNEAWTGTTGEVELMNNGDARTTFEVTVSNGSSESLKILTSTGRVYTPAAATAPSNERTFEVTAEGLSPSSGNYSLVTGVGGLYMSNNSKILAGDVYVNGEIRMSNSATIGLSTAPVTVNAAHQNCPISGGGTYPRLCETGEGEPIDLSSPQAHIYADVEANNQVDGDQMTDSGLINAPVISDYQNPPAGYVEPLTLPEHDRQAQVSNVSTTTSDGYYTNCDQNNVTRTWPGRLKIVGDVHIGKSCKVIVEGDVWITGRLTMQNSSQLIVSDTIPLGGSNTVNPELPTMMVDGQAGVFMQNSSEIIGNADDVGVQLIAYWSRAACSPDCADVTGNDLYASRNDRTIYMNNSSSAPTSILYSRWTQVEVNNGGDIGALAGQTVRLSNSAAVTFGTSVGSGGGSTPSTFVVRDYRRVL